MPTTAPDLTIPVPTRLHRLVTAVLTGASLVQAAAWPLAMRTSDAPAYVVGPAAWFGWILGTAGLLLFCGSAVWKREFQSLWGWTLIGVTVTALIVGGLATRVGGGTSYAHPTYALGLSAVAMAGTALGWRRMIPAGAAVVAAYLLGIIPTLLLGPVTLAPTLSNVGLIVVVGAVTTLLVPALFALSAQQERVRRELTAAQAAVTSAQAREQERARQYRTVHDTVLSTLTSLSRGSIDTQDPAVRRRLSADTDYLRGLIRSSDSRAGMYLVGELARITRELDPSGLRVHPHVDAVPDELPDDVATALADATREALNNVVKHSGKSEAWVTLIGGMPGPDGAEPKPGSVSMMITDRGRGFDPARASGGGLGLKHSLHERMQAVGGDCDIFSEPGQGTTVELRWPA